MQILAHRTAMLNAPPNSLEGLKYCWLHGVNVAECDVSFTKDAQPIIWLDANGLNLKLSEFKRNRPVFIEKMKLEEINNLERQDSSEKILTLEEVFDFLKKHPTFRVFFDIKYYSSDLGGIFRQISSQFINLTFQKVIQPAILSGLDSQIGFIVFDGGKRLIRRIKEDAPSVFTSLIVTKPWAQIVDCLAYVDAVTIGWKMYNHWYLFSNKLQKLIEETKKNKRVIWGGIAKNKFDLEWLERRGFSGVWVDDINMAQEILMKKKLSSNSHKL